MANRWGDHTVVVVEGVDLYLAGKVVEEHTCPHDWNLAEVEAEAAVDVSEAHVMGDEMERPPAKPTDHRRNSYGGGRQDGSGEAQNDVA